MFSTNIKRQKIKWNGIKRAEKNKKGGTKGFQQARKLRTEVKCRATSVNKNTSNGEILKILEGRHSKLTATKTYNSSLPCPH